MNTGLPFQCPLHASRFPGRTRRARSQTSSPRNGTDPTTGTEKGSAAASVSSGMRLPSASAARHGPVTRKCGGSTNSAENSRR